MNRRLFLSSSAALALSALAFTAMPMATNSASAADIFHGRISGVAINGYDPVGYFKQNKPVKGKAAHMSKWGGSTWHFASAANKAAFEANPGKYAPQYGGYCAYAAAKGYKAKTEPEAWTIVGGKLYLNYSLNVRALWDQNRTQYIRDGDEKWPKISG